MEHNSLEYIDQYFQGTPLPEEISAFERRITEEPEFAEDVAFYLSARRVLKEQLAEVKKQDFGRFMHKMVRAMPLKNPYVSYGPI